MLIGIIVGVVSSMGQHFMEKFRHRVDDTLDVWAIHGLGGTTGMICTSLFATTAANPAGGGGCCTADVPMLIHSRSFLVSNKPIYAGKNPSTVTSDAVAVCSVCCTFLCCCR